MKGKWLSSVSVLALVLGGQVVPVFGFSGARAADLAYEPVEAAPIAAPLFSWAGFYVGVHGGYVTGNPDETGVPEPTNPTEPTRPTRPTTAPTEPTFMFIDDPSSYASQVLGDAAAFGSGSFNAGLVGLHAGYNFQFDRFVVGFEGDIDYTGLKETTYSAPAGYDFRSSLESDWQGSMRARVGYAVDRLLVYGTGGVAFARGEMTVASNDLGFNRSDSNVHTGWTAGAGIEYAFTNNWLGRVEARYTDFGSKTYDFGDLGQVESEWDQTSILFGLGYKF